MKNFTKKIFNFIRQVLMRTRRSLLPPPRSPIPEKKTLFSMFEEEELINGYNHFKKYFKSAIFISSDVKIREYAILEAIKNDNNLENTYLEFGVYKGTTINFFSKYVKKIYGFDSFEGLREDWVGHEDNQAGYFNLNKKIPRLNSNVVPVAGWIQDTLINFLEKNKPEINFVHIDVDTYESTKYVLKNIKKYLKKKCIIIFDELYNFSGWSVGENQALTEVLNENEYKFLAFAKEGRQAVIKIL